MLNLTKQLLQRRCLPSTRTGILLASLVLVSSCATPPPPALDSQAWQNRQAALVRLAVWRAAGRIGVINGQEGWHANFQWAQQDANYRIELIGPLGQGRVLVQGDGREVTVQTQNGQQWTAPDADTLLEQHLGIRLPVNGLRYWVRGLPAPGSQPTKQLDDRGRLTRLEQNGWIIDYPAYQTVTSYELPMRIVAQRRDLNVKLIIEQWTL